MARFSLAEENALNDLADRICVPCQGGVPPLDAGQQADLLSRLGGDWSVVDGHHLWKRYSFPDFRAALAFANRAGAVAEEQGHHPDLLVAWGKVEVTIWTHKIDGLTESDFILAAKLDRLPSP